MLTHTQVWAAIDALAARYAMSASGLAKAAGLDPTTFNKSKRIAGNGKLRWPSTESIAKILTATGASTEEFTTLLLGNEVRAETRYLPLLRLSQVGDRTNFDTVGLPTGKTWERIAFPNLADEHAYVLEIADNALAPAYKAGDRIIVSPKAEVRRGDRAVVRTLSGLVSIEEVARITAARVELKSMRDGTEHARDLSELTILHRVIWSSL